jgi:hypothetical protein
MASRPPPQPTGVSPEDARDYVARVKASLGRGTPAYQLFLDTLTQYRSGAIAPQTVVARVSNLFRARRDRRALILGFNQFLPEGFHVGVSDGEAEEEEPKPKPRAMIRDEETAVAAMSSPPVVKDPPAGAREPTDASATAPPRAAAALAAVGSEPTEPTAAGKGKPTGTPATAPATAAPAAAGSPRQDAWGAAASLLLVVHGHSVSFFGRQRAQSSRTPRCGAWQPLPSGWMRLMGLLLNRNPTMFSVPGRMASLFLWLMAGGPHKSSSENTQGRGGKFFCRPRSPC